MGLNKKKKSNYLNNYKCYGVVLSPPDVILHVYTTSGLHTLWTPSEVIIVRIIVFYISTILCDPGLDKQENVGPGKKQCGCYHRLNVPLHYVDAKLKLMMVVFFSCLVTTLSNYVCTSIYSLLHHR